MPQCKYFTNIFPYISLTRNFSPSCIINGEKSEHLERTLVRVSSSGSLTPDECSDLLLNSLTSNFRANLP